MKKTKFVTLLLAMVMAFSLMATPALAASGAAYPASGPTYGGNPYAPVILGPGTVVAEDHSPYGLIHVFLENQVVVTMDEQFVLNYTATSGYVDRKFSSRAGYTWLVEEAMNRVTREKTVTRAADGKSLVYGDTVIHLSTATGEALALDYLITNFFRQPVKEIRTLDTVGYTLTYRNGKTATSYISVRTYGDALPSAAVYCDIWTVRELDDYTIEVYLRNGMVVTLEKAMIIAWVDARQDLGWTFDISSWHDKWEMDDEGAATCVDFCQTLLDALIRQGWTVFPAEALEPGYTYRNSLIRDGVMRWDVPTDRVLVRSLERLRSADTTSDVTIYFDYANQYGRWTHTVPYAMSFEFLCRSETTASGFNFYNLSRPEYFVRAFKAAQTFWLTDAEIQTISR